MNRHLTEPVSVPDELRQLPIGAVFTHANPNDARLLGESRCGFVPANLRLANLFGGPLRVLEPR
jgi:hypothetical protein